LGGGIFVVPTLRGGFRWLGEREWEQIENDDEFDDEDED